MIQLEINSTTTPILAVASPEVRGDVAIEVAGFVLEVLGTPAPKGSGRAIMRGGRAIHVPSGSDANKARLADWDSAVREVALRVIGHRETPPFVAVPLRLVIEFRMARPASHWGKGKRAGTLVPSAPRYPAKKPDSSKLLRSTEDTLAGIVFDDDARIVDTHVTKVWAAPGREGATIRVEAMP